MVEKTKNKNKQKKKKKTGHRKNNPLTLSEKTLDIDFRRLKYFFSDRQSITVK